MTSFSILILLASFNWYCAKSSNPQSTMSEVIMTDMETAFKAVTNATSKNLRNRIIPQLYNITSVSDFLFKIPNENLKFGCSIISVDRVEMMKPIFPNISLDQMEMVRNVQKIKSVAPENQDMNQNVDDIWSILGLEGWSGELVQPTDFLEIKHMDKINSGQMDNLTVNIGPPEGSNETTRDLINTSGTPLKNSTFADISENVYLARANNPFGFSTKWNFRNESKNTTKDERPRRAIIELYSMIKCATGCEPIAYKSYGCFCGFLGNGIAVDGIDLCCKQHDNCYAQSNCVSYIQYFVPYIWKCYHGKPICALSHGEFGGPASCAALLCYCDLRLAICLRKFSCPQCKATCRTSLSRKLQNLFF